MNTSAHSTIDEDDDVPAEEPTDPSRKELLEEQREIEAVFPEEWKELRVRKNGSGDAEHEVQALRLHFRSPFAACIETSGPTVRARITEGGDRMSTTTLIIIILLILLLFGGFGYRRWRR